MKHKLVKILSVVITIVCIICITNSVWAFVDASDLSGEFDGATNPSGSDKIRSILGTILSVVRTIAVGISIIIITFLGIKYMSAAPSEKANIKNQLIYFVLTAFCSFVIVFLY